MNLVSRVASTSNRRAQLSIYSKSDPEAIQDDLPLVITISGCGKAGGAP